jgi:hypothetical protein
LWVKEAFGQMAVEACTLAGVYSIGPKIGIDFRKA